MACEHGRRKDRCKDCGGNGMCEHNKRKLYCKDCVEVKCVSTVEDATDAKTVVGHKYVSITEEEVNIKTAVVVRYVSTTNTNKTVQTVVAGGAFYKSLKTVGSRTTGNRKLNGYCSHCFVNIFPEDPRALMVRKKSKELQVMTDIFSKYSGFKNDKPVYGCLCRFRRWMLRNKTQNMFKKTHW